MSLDRVVRSVVAGVLVLVLGVGAGCGGDGGSNAVDAALDQAAAPTAVSEPRDVVAVDTTPVPVGSEQSVEPTVVVDATESDVASPGPDGPLLLADQASIQLPSGWLVVDDPARAQELLASGIGEAGEGSLGQATGDALAALAAGNGAAVAVDPQTGTMATVVVTALSGGLSPTEDPEGWILAVGALATETIADSSFQGEPALLGGNTGVRSVIRIEGDSSPAVVHQFSAADGARLATITVSGGVPVDDEVVDAIFASLTFV